MKIFITGGTGFVGSHLVRRCVRDNHEVHVLLRAASDTWRIDDVLPRTKKHIADFTDSAALKKIMTTVQPDAIFHLATHTIYGAHSSQDNDGDIIQTNLLATLAFFETLNDIPYSCFINTGSSAEYGVRITPKLMKETDACKPVHAYSATKCATAIFGQYLAVRKKKPIMTFRLFLPFGPFGDKNRLIPHAILSTLKNQDLALANPNAARDYVYIDDVVDAYMRGLTKAGECAGEIFNIGGGKQYTLEDTVRTIIQETGSPISVRWDTKPQALWDSEFCQADITKAKRMLGWKPQHTFEKGIEKTIAWFRKNEHYYTV